MSPTVPGRAVPRWDGVPNTLGVSPRGLFFSLFRSADPGREGGGRRAETHLGEEDGRALPADRPDAISPLPLGEQGHRVQGVDRLVESAAEAPDQDDVVLPADWDWSPCPIRCGRRRRRGRGVGSSGSRSRGRRDLAGLDRVQARDVLPEVGREFVGIALDSYTLHDRGVEVPTAVHSAFGWSTDEGHARAPETKKGSGPADPLAFTLDS